MKSYHFIGPILVVATLKAVHLYVTNRRGQKEINEVLFFPDDEFPCTQVIKEILKVPQGEKVCYNPSCRRLHGQTGECPSSMIKFLYYLGQAKHSVDLCIYMFTQKTMSKLLQDLHKMGIRVRIITDAQEDDGYSSQTDSLQKAGIEIKSNKGGAGALMHHKFVIIDERLLISGSFNWTNKAVVSNYEAVLVTSAETLVKPFVNKFNELWSKFKQHK